MMTGRMKCGLACVLLGACAPDRPDRLTGDLFLEGVGCRPEVLSTLDEWGAGREYLAAPPEANGFLAYRFPTQVVGEWVVLEALPGGRSTVVRVTETTLVAKRFEATCDPDEERSARLSRSSDGPRFTDSDLRATLRSAGDGPVVVYAWAPHMPLSLDGWAEIAEAGRSVGATVVPVLIAHSDLDFAAREATRVGMPAAGLRQIDANDLLLRDAQLHAPSILVFGPDRVSPVLPGYRNASGYRRYLEAFIAGGR